MSKDTIYREDAIKAVIEAMDKHCNGYNSFRDRRIRNAIEGVPSARPKEGKWIEVEWYPIAVPSKWCENDEKPIYVSKLQCSKCGFTHNFLDGHTAQYNFCPNCGADMRERKDFQVIVNGNCTKCGKPLSGNRIFICEECEEQSKESE